MLSQDTYLARTHKRDAEYELVYKVRGRKINGKRMRSGTYSRKYVD
ncbi:MAG: hypothetical protein IKD26_01545 [Clostridia bacterium]|nr:hypothetical protein [Clostridia bacterium]